MKKSLFSMVYLIVINCFTIGSLSAGALPPIGKTNETSIPIDLELKLPGAHGVESSGIHETENNFKIDRFLSKHHGLSGRYGYKDNGDSEGKGSSQNVDVIGRWPYGPAYSVATDNTGNIVFLGSGGGVYILDVSGSNPQKLGEVATPGFVNDIYYKNYLGMHYLYIADD